MPKTILAVCLILAPLLLLGDIPASAQSAAANPAGPAAGAADGGLPQALSQAAPLLSAQRAADHLENVTGTAISPGLFILAAGAWRYWRSDDRSRLPWHSSLKFLVGLAAVMLLFMIKDGIPFEPLQKLLASFETGFNGLWGLIALATVTPELAGALEPAARAALDLLLRPLSAAPALAAEIPAAAGGSSQAASVLAAAAGTLVFAVVWCVANSVNLLCLIAPGFCAPVLKGLRTLVAGSLVALTAVHPLLGIAACLLVIILSLVLFRWSLRLTVWGLLFAFDLVFRRWRRPPKPGPEIEAFACGGARRLWRIPKRTRGVLDWNQGALSFSYRRLLFLRREVPLSGLPGDPLVGRRLFAPVLAFQRPDGGCGELFAFRLRGRGHEERLAASLGVPRIENLGLRSAASRSWTWLRGLASRREPELAVV